jgi:hypothetical protein
MDRTPQKLMVYEFRRKTIITSHETTPNPPIEIDEIACEELEQSLKSLKNRKAA